MCYTCDEREKRRIEEEEKDEKERERRLKGRKIFKYIGESARSVYERSREHLSDMEQLKPCTHLLKHLLDVHEGEERSEIQFGIKVIKYTRSSFERQILESVIIQQERHHHLLNSKAEYNRSAVPRLATKIGESQYKKWEKDIEIEKEKHEKLEERIRQLRKERNKERRNPGQRQQPAGKRRKVENGYEESLPQRGRPSMDEKGEKRRKDEHHDESTQPKKKLRQMKIGEKIPEKIVKVKLKK